MSTFIEVESVNKGCKVIVNLDQVVEVAPLISGGCVLTMATKDAGVSTTINVKNDYSQFLQFALQTVSADDIKKRMELFNNSVEKRGPGRPPKNPDISVESTQSAQIGVSALE